jgi:sec-independent protein translocase protein TatB
MGNLGGGEILVIFLAALIFLGPEKLPEVARQIGKVVGEVRKVSAGFQREVHDAMRMVEDAVTAAERERPAPPAVTEPALPAASEAADEPALPAASEPGAPSADPPLPAQADAPAHESLSIDPPTSTPVEPSLGGDVAHGGDR